MKNINYAEESTWGKECLVLSILSLKCPLSRVDSEYLRLGFKRKKERDLEWRYEFGVL